jgi:dephospho-CoA kinase
VDSDLEIRYERIKTCRNLSQEDFFQCFSRQLDDQEKLNRCDAVIYNFENSEILPQVLALDERIKTLK